MIHNGSCLCGQVSYCIDGPFESFYLCHCQRCRKDSGSAHAANLFSTTATLNWLSGEHAINTFTLPGTQHSRAFCRDCGSALPCRQMQGALLVVPAGSLDSELKLEPDAHIFVVDRALWDCGLEQRPHCSHGPTSN